MERNQNGYPVRDREGVTGGDNGCGSEEKLCMGDMRLAYAYVPIQKWQMLYSTDEALGHGTMFEELYKPMEVYGNEW